MCMHDETAMGGMHACLKKSDASGRLPAPAVLERT